MGFIPSSSTQLKNAVEKTQKCVVHKYVSREKYHGVTSQWILCCFVEVIMHSCDYPRDRILHMERQAVFLYFFVDLVSFFTSDAEFGLKILHA